MVRSSAIRCAWLVCALWACSGCQHMQNSLSRLSQLDARSINNCLPQIDPSGRSIFKHEARAVSYQPEPGPIDDHLANHQAALQISPQQVVAPVGAEVVVKASVCGLDGRTSPYQRVEWTLSQGGVGEIVTVGDRGSTDFLFGAPRPQKLTANYAVGSTVGKNICLTRGTPTCQDDVSIVTGQSWITVTSPREGTSQITAFAPSIYGWDQRTKTTSIQWIDAAWNFPPPSINPAGTRQTLVTTVVRQSNRLPLPGYRVRYEVLGGPSAGFAPDGNPVIEAVTDNLGQARVEIFQPTPAAGTNNIGITITRPGEQSTDGLPLQVAAGTTQKTWGSPDLFLRKTGPEQAALGAVLNYVIEVRNTGSQPLRDVVVVDPLPAGTSLVSANPVATTAAGALNWPLGTLSPGESRRVEVNLRADRFGSIANCATVRTADGAVAQDCVTTTVAQPQLEVNVQGPDQAPVGSDVTFVATITNRSAAPARNVVIVERFDSGLRHPVANSPIEADLGELAPGQSRQVTATFQVIATGPQCNTVDVVGEGGVRASGRACVTGVPSASPPAAPGGFGVAPVPFVPGQPTQPPAPAQPPAVNTPPVQPSTGPKPVLNVRKSGPVRKVMGEQAEFTIDITNVGSVPATNVKIADSYDLALDPVNATDGHRLVGNDLVWVVDTLPPGKTIRFQINCKCVGRADRACNRATVTCDEQVRGDGEACLEIVAFQSQLSVTVADSKDPVSVGGDVTFDVRVTNNAQVPDARVEVAVTLPPELQVVGGAIQGPTAGRVQGAFVVFDPIATLAPGQTASFRVPCRAARQGTVQTRAEVRSASTPTPQAAIESTTVF